MKNIKYKKFKKFHVLVLGILIIINLVFFLTNKSRANEKISASIVKGVFSERVEEVEYEKIIEYGPSGVYSIKNMTDVLNIEVFEEDRVKAFPDPSLGIGSKIEILRANPVYVDDSKDKIMYRTWAKNVGEFIEENQISIGENDIVSISLDEKITRDLNISITRVAISELIERETIDYEEIRQNDPTLERGLTKVKQNSQYGEKKLTYVVRRENGVEISKKLIKTEIIKDPVDKIILVGTKVTILGSGKASWYDWISGNTAAHNTLPMGSEVLVRGSNGKSVKVKIVDRGIKTDAIIDLSADAFRQLAPLGAGIINVTLEKI